MLIVLLLLAAPALSFAAPIYSYDFEDTRTLAEYDGLSFTSAEPEIVSPGAGGSEHCLRLQTPEPAKYCPMSINVPFTVEKNLVLSFDYRAVSDPEPDGNYVGILFFDANGKQFGRFDHRFSDQWRHAEVPFGSLGTPNEGVLDVGLELVRLNLYGRADEDGAMMTVWLDNISLEARTTEGVLSDTVQTSWANPPLLCWGATEGVSRLEYSRSPDFPEDETRTAETKWGFFMPERPLDPGEWYWRVWVQTPLSEGWGTIHRLEIAEEAHTFTTRAIDPDAIEAMERPRLIDVEKARAGADLEAMVAAARSEAEQPIPDDPPIFTEGDPRWGEWIDWYRDVHGGITSRTGRRLEIMAQRAAITGDEQVRDWTLELALAVASWDPDGGSAVHRGDIGAQHVLRGLNTAYDVLHDHASEEDLATIREAIVARAEDFWDTLCPLRGDPQNNHTWLRALALGQSGLVLIGDHEDAPMWAEYARQLYLGQFLAGMGFQGDNNEGLSYWSYGLSFIIEYADMMLTVTGIDLYQHPWLNQTARFPMYCAPPGAWGVSFADTGKPNHGIKGPYSQSYVGRLAERTGDPYALWYSGRGPIEGLMPRPPVDIPQSIHYRFIGLGIANTSIVDGREGVTFAMHSGPFWAGHQHADQNAFVLHAYGEKLAIDSGYYDWYGSPHFKQYSIQTMAHNSVLVNGEGQAAMTDGADGRMAAWFDGLAHNWMVGDASDPDLYGGKLTRFDRRTLFVKPDLVVIHDLLEAPEPSAFQWLLHTVAPIEAKEAARSVEVASGEAAMSVKFLRPETIAMTVDDQYPVHPYDGYGTVPIPEDELAEEWHLTAEAEPATERQFLAVIDVRRAARQPASIRQIECEGGVGLQAARDGRRTTVLLAPDRLPAALASEHLAGVGEALAVTTEDGGLASACAINAGEMTWRGEPLLRTDAHGADMSLLVTEAGWIAQVALPDDASLLLPMVEGRVLVDGRPADARQRDGMLALSLRAGQHTIAWGEAPEQALPHVLEPIEIHVGDRSAGR